MLIEAHIARRYCSAVDATLGSAADQFLVRLRRAYTLAQVLALASDY